MHYLLTVILVMTSLLKLNSAFNKSYVGYKIFRLMPSTEQIPTVRMLQSMDGIDFWSHFRSSHVDVMVAPKQQKRFQDFLRKGQIDAKLQINDLQRILEKERKSQRKMGRRFLSEISFDHFNRYSEINQYLEHLAKKYPEKASVTKIGNSYEGRDINVIKITSTKSSNFPVILIDAGIHAREWVAPAMALYIINQLVENSNNSELISSVEWHIIPLLNPDGYEYTHTEDRMWRKTRSRANDFCVGVDGNRNFDFHFDEVGTEEEPCSEIYAGKNAFSESETQALRDYALKLQPRIKLYLTFHAYGNVILHPWGYTKVPPENAEDLAALALSANEANVKQGGDEYRVGSSARIFYDAAGGSDDWMMAKAGALYSYTVELTDTISGFCLPSKMIWPTVKKFFEAVRVFGNHIKNLST